MMKPKDTDSEIIDTVVYQNENNIRHSNFINEMAFYTAVKNADFDYLNKYFTRFNINTIGLLSENPITNLKYHLIITISMITRFCIEGKMDYELAYTLSDIYIRKCDKCTTVDEIEKVHYQVVYDFAQRMVDINTQNAKSITVLQCIEYIADHISDKITLSDLSKLCHLNSSYLSTLFKKEMGISISEYIINRKISMAKDMLTVTDYSPLYISNYLSFCSHSYFIKLFKLRTGITPEAYRNINYRKTLQK